MHGASVSPYHPFILSGIPATDRVIHQRSHNAILLFTSPTPFAAAFARTRDDISLCLDRCRACHTRSGPSTGRCTAGAGFWPDPLWRQRWDAAGPVDPRPHHDRGRRTADHHGEAADIQALRAQGAVVTLLDGATTGRIYYLADAYQADAYQADATANDAVSQTQAVADVLLAGTDVLLLATTPEREATLLATLPANGIAVALLDAAIAGEATASAAQLRLDSPGAAPALPNPAVAALLPLLNESDLRMLVDQLSGQTPVTVNGASVTLTTRHTLAARLRSAEDYVYQWYSNLGIPVSYFAWQYGSYSGRNVIAEVRGRTNPEQVLIIGGHLDNTSQTPYTLAPGADDIGSYDIFS